MSNLKKADEIETAISSTNNQASCVEDPRAACALFAPHTPAGEVGRNKGWHYVFPFTSILAKWTEGIWPNEGSFDEDKLDFAGSQMNPLKGDLKWDYEYMMDCLIVWSRHARERSSSGKQGKMATWGMEKSDQ